MSYDVDKIRQQFPMLNSGKKMQGHPLVYLDNCSTTFKPKCVIDAISSYYTDSTANSHRGDYDLLYQMDVEVLNTRKAVARFVNCDVNEVIFTSGTTMSLNQIAFGYGLKKLRKGDEIILSEEEHASNVLPWFNVAKSTGAVIKYVPLTKEGDITEDNLRKVISRKTKVVSLVHVGNVLGNINDVKMMARVAHEFGAIIAIDGAQSVPHLKTDFKAWDIDFLSFSAHKMCGPTGIGCLIGKASLLKEMEPLISGGGNNVDFHMDGTVEYLDPPAKFEAGTLNLSGILGFKKAIEFIESIGVENIHQHDRELIEYALEKLDKCDDIIIYNKYAKNGILTFNRKGVFAQDEATLLNSKGIAVRSGQHCAKILDQYLNCKATVRMSTYLYTNKNDIDVFVDALIEGGDILDAYFTN
ncbi:MAG TPA: cysteine desulfurase [Bacilli bacterium]|mgnify:CR=1 FL=1|nr:cysteine desulfurase [Bacilli bacterium]